MREDFVPAVTVDNCAGTPHKVIRFAPLLPSVSGIGIGITACENVDCTPPAVFGPAQTFFACVRVAPEGNCVHPAGGVNGSGDADGDATGTGDVEAEGTGEGDELAAATSTERITPNI